MIHVDSFSFGVNIMMVSFYVVFMYDDSGIKCVSQV